VASEKQLTYINDLVQRYRASIDGGIAYMVEQGREKHRSVKKTREFLAVLDRLSVSADLSNTDASQIIGPLERSKFGQLFDVILLTNHSLIVSMGLLPAYDEEEVGYLAGLARHADAMNVETVRWM
jgi:hypothetical protein